MRNFMYRGTCVVRSCALDRFAQLVRKRSFYSFSR